MLCASRLGTERALTRISLRHCVQLPRASARENYQNLYQQARDNPETFWGEQAKSLSWTTPPQQMLCTKHAPISHWFPDGTLNMTENAIDRHLQQGRAEQVAIQFHSAYSDSRISVTYEELQDYVSRISSVIESLGAAGYDKETNPDPRPVLIYMPNSVEAVVAMLACARRGIPHSVVFGGFAAEELAGRIRHASPSLIIASSCGIEPKRVIPYKPIVDEARKLAGAEDTKCLLVQRPESRGDMHPDLDFDWHSELKRAASAPAVPVPSNHPLYILYTSGTTGQPKGIVRDTGGYATALQWSMEHIYHIQAGDTYWAASDVGWVVGHSYMVYGPLLMGCKSVVFEGKPVGTPDAGTFWRVMKEHQVNTFFTAPTAFRAIRREDPEGNLLKETGDLDSLRGIFLAGERSDPETIEWASRVTKKPIIDNYWQTETGWPIVSNFLSPDLAQPIKPGSSSFPIPGYNLNIRREDNSVADVGELGRLSVSLPLPPGCMIDLYRNTSAFQEKYFPTNPNQMETGDHGYIDEDGYVHIMTRSGDLINVAGHRLDTGSLEEALAAHADVAECAVIGVHDDVKGQIPLGFVVPSSSGSQRDSMEDFKAECIRRVRTKIGAVAAFNRVIVVSRLPKTRSGKILRGELQKMVDGKPWKVVAVVEDPAVYAEIQQTLQDEGFEVHPETIPA